MQHNAVVLIKNKFPRELPLLSLVQAQHSALFAIKLPLSALTPYYYAVYQAANTCVLSSENDAIDDAAIIFADCYFRPPALNGFTTSTHTEIHIFPAVKYVLTASICASGPPPYIV